MEVSVKTECSTDGADTALSESNRYDGHCGNSANKWEVNPEKNNEVTNTPHTQMVAIQVRLELEKSHPNTEIFPLIFSLPLGFTKILLNYWLNIGYEVFVPKCVKNI